jgi:hypothetical protein
MDSFLCKSIWQIDTRITKSRYSLGLQKAGFSNDH